MQTPQSTRLLDVYGCDSSEAHAQLHVEVPPESISFSKPLLKLHHAPKRREVTS